MKRILAIAINFMYLLTIISGFILSNMALMEGKKMLGIGIAGLSGALISFAVIKKIIKTYF